MSVSDRFSKDPIIRHNLVEEFEEARSLFEERLKDKPREVLLVIAEDAYYTSRSLEGSIEAAKKKFQGYCKDPLKHLEDQIEELEGEIAELS